MSDVINVECRCTDGVCGGGMFTQCDVTVLELVLSDAIGWVVTRQSDVITLSDSQLVSGQCWSKTISCGSSCLTFKYIFRSTDFN